MAGHAESIIPPAAYLIRYNNVIIVVLIQMFGKTLQGDSDYIVENITGRYFNELVFQLDFFFFCLL